jgi:hypothetical protein
MPSKPPHAGKLLNFPDIPEPAETKAFIDHYLELADKLLTPNLERETPADKSEPYNPPSEQNKR